MKKLFKGINKISFILSIIIHLWAFKAHGGNFIATVNSIKGAAFVTSNGETIQLKIGDELLKNAEISTTAMGAVSFSDYHDHQFHLPASSHVKLLGNNLQLRRGFVWVQSYSHEVNSGFELSTANAVARYDYGESILSFDPVTAKSQLLVIKGRLFFSNLQNHMDRVLIEDGQFSYVQMKSGKGLPRRPTPVGYSSFKKITSLFHKVSPMGVVDHIAKRVPRSQRKVEKMNRGIASISFPVKKRKKIKRKLKNSGRIIYINGKKITRQNTKNEKSFLDKQLSGFSRRLNKKNVKKNILKRSHVPVRVYGTYLSQMDSPSFKKRVIKNIKKTRKKESKRSPASIPPSQVLSKTEKVVDRFEKGLGQEYRKQMRHSPEVNSLIRDLKNYNQDFKTAY